MKSYNKLLVAALFSFACLSGLTATAGEITAEKAIETALAMTGGGEVIELNRHPVRGGDFVYRMEIDNNGTVYHIALDAATGNVIQLNRKQGFRERVADFNRSVTGTAPASPTGEVAGGPSSMASALTGEQAMQLALQEVGGGTVMEWDSDFKRSGIVVYEFEILNNGHRSEIEIDSNGRILKLEQKNRRSISARMPNNRLTAANAIELAKQSADGFVIEYELDHDDGAWVHEITLTKDGRRFKRVVDDASGQVY
ncbi:MAG: PepSY domain-containing protein [Planctomycetes bacterium]|nr:PepSY domain-containing protein [Planctomycetota bacterium]